MNTIPFFTPIQFSSPTTFKEKVLGYVENCFDLGYSCPATVISGSRFAYIDDTKKGLSQPWYQKLLKISFIACFPLSLVALATRQFLRNHLDIKLATFTRLLIAETKSGPIGPLEVFKRMDTEEYGRLETLRSTRFDSFKVIKNSRLKPLETERNDCVVQVFIEADRREAELPGYLFKNRREGDILLLNDKNRPFAFKLSQQAHPYKFPQGKFENIFQDVQKSAEEFVKYTPTYFAHKRHSLYKENRDLLQSDCYSIKEEGKGFSIEKILNPNIELLKDSDHSRIDVPEADTIEDKKNNAMIIILDMPGISSIAHIKFGVSKDFFTIRAEEPHLLPIDIKSPSIHRQQSKAIYEPNEGEKGQVTRNYLKLLDWSQLGLKPEEMKEKFKSNKLSLLLKEGTLQIFYCLPKKK
jgi:HSP20 family molecular chaperone IbpA